MGTIIVFVCLLLIIAYFIYEDWRNGDGTE